MSMGKDEAANEIESNMQGWSKPQNLKIPHNIIMRNQFFKLIFQINKDLHFFITNIEFTL